MRPNFGDIKDIKSVVFSSSFRHNLDMNCPWWVISVSNVFEEILLTELWVCHLHFHGFFTSETLDTLVSLKVILDKVSFTFLVNPYESMRTVSIHVSETVRSTSIWEENADLVEGNWVVLPEIEDHVRISQIGLWVWFLGMNKLWEFHWIVDKENWCVVSNHVVISFFCVKFDSKSSWISNNIRSTFRPSNSRKSYEHWCLFSNFA